MKYNWLKFKKIILKIFSVHLNIAPVYIYAFLTIIIIILKILNKIPLLTFNGAIVALIVAFASSYFQKKRNERQTALITFTAKYLLEKETSYVDEILGTLISGRFTKVKIDPLSEFFNCLKSIASGKDFEMRRRIAEALPALYQIDLKKAKDLYEILRVDWDDRWKADNRRRAIESLISLITIDESFVIENTYLIDNDQVFTIIALVEVLANCAMYSKWEDIEPLFNNLKNDMTTREYSSNEIESINELWHLMKLINQDIKSALSKCDTLKSSTNEYVQICVARNLKFFYKKFPDKTLRLIEYFINLEIPKNVRRPIAKDDNLDCLIYLCKDKKCCVRAQAVIWKLMTDDDEIIRLASFDKIEKVLSINKKFGKDILIHIIDHNNNPKLVERAKILLQKT